MYEYDSILGLYSKNNYLSKKLKERFIDKYVNVLIFDDASKIDYSKFSYLIIDLFDLNITDGITNLIKNVNCKVLVLVPYKIKNPLFMSFTKKIDSLLEANTNLGIILAPEMVGSGVYYNENYITHKIIKNSLFSERIVIGDNPINVISLSKFVGEVIKENFSFGISGKKLLISGYCGSQRDFVSKYLKITNDYVDIRKEVNNYSEIVPNMTKKVLTSLKTNVLNLKMEWSVNQINEINTQILNKDHNVQTDIPSFGKENKNKKKTIKKFVFILILLISLYLLPLVLLMGSMASLMLSSRFVLNNPKVSENLILTSNFLSNRVNNLNFGNTFYIESSNLIIKINNIARNSLDIVAVGNSLIINIIGNKTYVLENYTDQISANLDKIYTDINFLQSDITEQQGVVGKEINNFLISKKINTSKFKNNIYNLKKVVSRLSELLGWQEPKKYLILFQNNMELRPTGGFIGSFALITLDKGRMTQMTVNDVYSADGQLKGHIEPPTPIREYLGEASWYLRDSNWDPDFTISAEKIKWFLDKAIDQKVDGVIAIDLFFIKSLLEITGPINLTDFGKTINTDNLYDTTQSEVEDDFFAGSIKKASFLSALSKSLLQEIQYLSEDKYIVFFKTLYKSLEQKHIQIYFNDLNAQTSVKDLGYAGNINMDTNCNLRCFSDGYGLVDSNLGINKSNQFILRRHELNLTLSQNSIHHELFVTYQNKAGRSIGSSGTYKNYARLVLPQGINIKGIRMYQIDGSFVDLEYDIEDYQNRKDIGFYFEVPPDNITKIQAVWISPTDKLSQGGEYRMKVRKQAGTEQDPLNINISYQDLSLTGDIPSHYNTDLAYDFNLKLFVKP
ncbi:MAG: hypothetical protein UR39_C0010G0035 [Candidatus Woesebacteria bacterium GW2011_GWA1_33_30]|uniref:DUF4012 domain-containing protein n=1 Tax=Candidatus Woesebacteria bacterium GW2011_GWA2_33_28 TaxID=1618561 RepID=A0A0F9ZQE2_9BACT|nr:MAG: hypothetical protein UR38_C0010G0034 [Candidatus Woesebacteria bacterium GW2011_GWA2_33_28]KKP47293.1 MAG: hypothetical protein UR39_C0010G0035 [Candidatus Woesebacteria bacterium GW2011_GWA1_33_30]KKP48938.1 MAG: hypothetical protein UR40_C0011G0034 [Microgenomates group bacterium GW2011_GWC1_33_32]KKP51476.1 MAG: hypothetical protein UR44_C0010G0034 [Candidatus Woesebacteria bacterium GW2011_GWB1_33_38]KKP57479.1 MAG: hypothetical protein UR48_C0016G0005 [Microgenomates group bacteriu